MMFLPKPEFSSFNRRPGYSLVELLTSVVLTMMLMAAVVQIFGVVGNSVGESRALLGLHDRLRTVANRLREDIQGSTCTMTPPASPENNEGYFEIIEGPMGPVLPLENPDTTVNGLNPNWPAVNTDDPDNPVQDTSVIDVDDILMFTTRSKTEPFLGRAYVKMPNSVIKTEVESNLAEVVWFVRGRTLYRRVMLITPGLEPDLRADAQKPANYHTDKWTFSYLNGTHLASLDAEDRGFYNNFDISVHAEDNPWRYVPNSLADLTKRENRFAHSPYFQSRNTHPIWAQQYPYHPYSRCISGYLKPFPGCHWQFLGMPLLQEMSHVDWTTDEQIKDGRQLPLVTLTPNEIVSSALDGKFDAWNEPVPYNETEPSTGCLTDYREGPRVGEDVILDNVIGFDIKVWDPEAVVISYDHDSDPGTPELVVSPGDPAYFEAVISGSPTVISRGAYVDLGYNASPYRQSNRLPKAAPNWVSSFSEAPEGSSGLRPFEPDDTLATTYPDRLRYLQGFVYDTGSTQFDRDEYINTVIDPNSHTQTVPPYAVPLEGIQIKIRVFEPKSRQIREFTVREHFSNL